MGLKSKAYECMKGEGTKWVQKGRRGGSVI